MYYEKETYRKETPKVPKAFEVVHLPSGITYKSMKEASEITGLSLYKIRNSSEFSRPAGFVHPKRKIKNCATGEIYESINSACELTGISIGMMRKHLARGIRFTNVAQRHVVKRKKVLRDDTGVTYRTMHSLAKAKGISHDHAAYLVALDPERTFRNEWLGLRQFRTIRHDGKWWWVNGTIPVSTPIKLRKVLRALGIRHIPETGDLFK